MEIMEIPEHERWMRLALEEARLAAQEGEVPVGAAVVLDGELLARDHNRSVQAQDPTAHAEILVIRAAAAGIGNYRLGKVDLYVTLEPCTMCAGALIWARVGRLVFGARDPKGGGVYSKAELLKPALFNHTVTVVEGILAAESSQLLQEFFRARR